MARSQCLRPIDRVLAASEVVDLDGPPQLAIRHSYDPTELSVVSRPDEPDRTQCVRTGAAVGKAEQMGDKVEAVGRIVVVDEHDPSRRVFGEEPIDRPTDRARGANVFARRPVRRVRVDDRAGREVGIVVDDDDPTWCERLLPNQPECRAKRIDAPVRHDYRGKFRCVNLACRGPCGRCVERHRGHRMGSLM